MASSAEKPQGRRRGGGKAHGASTHAESDPLAITPTLDERGGGARSTKRRGVPFQDAGRWPGYKFVKDRGVKPGDPEEKGGKGDKKPKNEGPSSPNEGGPMSRGEQVYREELAKAGAENPKADKETLVKQAREVMLLKEHHFRVLKAWKREASRTPGVVGEIHKAKEKLAERNKAVESHEANMPMAFVEAMELTGEPPKTNRERSVRARTAFEKAVKASPENEAWFKELEKLEGERDIAQGELRALRGSSAEAIEVLEKLYGTDAVERFADLDDHENRDLEAERTRNQEGLDYLQVFSNRDDARDDLQTGRTGWVEFSKATKQQREILLSGEGEVALRSGTKSDVYSDEETAKLFEDRAYTFQNKKGKPVTIELADKTRSKELVLPNPGKAEVETVAPETKEIPESPAGGSVEVKVASNTIVPPPPGDTTETVLTPSQIEIRYIGEELSKLMEEGGRVDKKRFEKALGDLIKVSAEQVGADPKNILGKKRKVFEEAAYRLADLLVGNGYPKIKDATEDKKEVEKARTYIFGRIKNYGEKTALTWPTTNLAHVLADSIKHIAHKEGIRIADPEKQRRANVLMGYIRQLARNV